MWHCDYSGELSGLAGHSQQARHQRQHQHCHSGLATAGLSNLAAQWPSYLQRVQRKRAADAAAVPAAVSNRSSWAALCERLVRKQQPQPELHQGLGPLGPPPAERAPGAIPRAASATAGGTLQQHQAAATAQLGEEPMVADPLAAAAAAAATAALPGSGGAPSVALPPLPRPLPHAAVAQAAAGASSEWALTEPQAAQRNVAWGEPDMQPTAGSGANAAGSQARACGGGGKADQQPAAPASPPPPQLPPTPVDQAAAAETRSAADVAAAGAAATTAAAAVVACAPGIAPVAPAAAATTAAAAQTQQLQAPLQPPAAARQQQQGVEKNREEEVEDPDSVLKLPAPKSLDELKQVLQQHASTPAPRTRLEGAKYRAPSRGCACEPAECVPAEPQLAQVAQMAQVAQVAQVARVAQVGCCESPGTPGSSARCARKLAAAAGAEVQPPPPPQQQHKDAKDAPQHSNRSGGSKYAAAGAAGGHSGGGGGACRRHGAVKRKRGAPAAAAGGDPQQPTAQRRRLTGVPTCSANGYGAGKSRSLVAAGAAGDGGDGSAAAAAAEPDGAVMLVPSATPSLAAAARPRPLLLPPSPAGKAGWEQQQRPQQQRGSHGRSVGGAAGGGQRPDVGAGTAAGTAPPLQSPPPPLLPPVPAGRGGAARLDPKSLTALLRSPDIRSAELASQLLGPNTCMEPAAAALHAGGGHGPEQQVALTKAACRQLERVGAVPGAAGGDSSDAAVGMALARCLLRLMSLGPDNGRPDTAEAALWGNRFPDLLPAAGLHALQTGTMQQPEAQELLLAGLQAVQDLCGDAGGRDRLGARFVPLALAVLSHMGGSVCAYSLRLRRAAASTLLDLVTESRGSQLALFDAAAASSTSTGMTEGAAGDEVAAAADAAASVAKHADRVFRELLPAAADYPTQLDLLEALYRACCGGTRSAAARERQSAAACSRERLVAAGERVLRRYLPPEAAACMAGLVSKRKRVKEEDLAARLRRVLGLVNQAQGERASVFSYHAEEVLLAGAPAGLRFAERWVDVAVLDSGSRTQSRNDDHGGGAAGGPSSGGGGSGPRGPRRPSGHLTLRAQVRNAELPKDEQSAPEPLTIRFDDIVAVTVSPPPERRPAGKATNAGASAVAAAAGDGAAAATTSSTTVTIIAPAPLCYVLITLSRLPEGLEGAAAADTDRPAAASGGGGGWRHAPVLRLKLAPEDARALLRRLPQETVRADSAGAGSPGPRERRRGTRPDASAARAQLPAVPPPPTAPTAAAAAETSTDTAADVSLPQPLMLAAVVPMASTPPATPAAAAAAAALVAVPTGAMAATPATFAPAATPAPPLQQVAAVPRAPGRRRQGGADGTAAHGEERQSQQLPSSSSSSSGGAAVGSCRRPAENHPPPAAGGGAAGGPCSRPPAAGAGAEAGDAVAVGSGPGAVRRAGKPRRAHCRRKQPRPRRYLVDAHVLVAPVLVQQAQLQQLPRPPQVPPAPPPLQPPPPLPPPPQVVPLAPQAQQRRQTYSANGPEPPSLQHAAAAVALFIGYADAAREVLQQVGMGGSDSDTSSSGGAPALGCILLATTAQSRWHGGIEPSRGRPGGDLMRAKR